MDHFWLTEALKLAKIRRGFCSPNPSVGALIVKNNNIIASGYHLKAGAPHAEIEVLRLAGESAEGSTLYVTLEPCCHFGRTPPCTQTILEKKVGRVVFGYLDPNPLVSGKGQKELREKGVACEWVEHPDTTAFYKSYRHWTERGRPVVTAKLAMSLDGKIAGKNGLRINISGEELFHFTHEMRHHSDAILTTVSTVVQDNPRLNARGNETIFKPVFVIDRDLRFPLDAELLSSAELLTLFCASENSTKRKSLEERGVRCIEVPSEKGLMSWEMVLSHIGRLGIHDLLVEAGGRCIDSLAKVKLLDRAFIYVSPKWLGLNSLIAFPGEAKYFEAASSVRWESKGRDAICELQWG